jgi:hypothetical protein
MKDGRKSFRQIFSLLLILINNSPLTSLMFLKVNTAKSIYVANKLSEIPEVKCVRLITRMHSIIVKLTIAEGGTNFTRSSDLPEIRTNT